MLLILGVFLTKYVVGVELAMQPALAHDGAYTLAVATIYGVFSGLFVGRAARLWRLTARPGTPSRGTHHQRLNRQGEHHETATPNHAIPWSAWHAAAPPPRWAGTPTPPSTSPSTRCWR